MRPLHYKTIMTNKRALAFVPICWSIAVIWSLVNLQGIQFIPENICSLEHALSPVFLIFFSLLITLPIFTAIFVYSVILCTYKKRQRMIQKQAKIIKESEHFSMELTFTRRGRRVSDDLGINERSLLS